MGLGIGWKRPRRQKRQYSVWYRPGSDAAQGVERTANLASIHVLTAPHYNLWAYRIMLGWPQQPGAGERLIQFFEDYLEGRR